MNWEDFLNTVIGWATTTGIKLVISLIVLLISFRVINLIAKRIIKKNEKSGKVDRTVARTLCNVGKTVLKIIIVICLVGYLGIDTSALSALVASVGVTVGLAVNGALSNFAGGILLLFTRPFHDGDFVEVNGVSGTVEDIRIINTKIVTLDNKVVYLPNSLVSSTTVTNYTEKDLRRVDLTFSIPYDNDYAIAEEIISNVAESNSLVLKDPSPTVRMTGHGKSSLEICCRVWVKKEDYWTVYFDMLEDVKTAFDEQGIEIPYDQVDIHVRRNKR